MKNLTSSTLLAVFSNKVTENKENYVCHLAWAWKLLILILRQTFKTGDDSYFLRCLFLNISIIWWFNVKY